jgi:hypothetical protein
VSEIGGRLDPIDYRFTTAEFQPRVGEWLYRPFADPNDTIDLIVDLDPYEFTVAPQRLRGTAISHPVTARPSAAVVYELHGDELCDRGVWEPASGGRVTARMDDGSTWCRSILGRWRLEPRAPERPSVRVREPKRGSTKSRYVLVTRHEAEVEAARRTR